MPRKRRSTKSRIVKAAWNLFYKNGYEQTTVEDIINASKTSKGTFYHYFLIFLTRNTKTLLR